MNPWITACLLAWQTILALFVPLYAALHNFAHEPSRADGVTVAVYFAGVLLMLLILTAFTPRRWWIQPTLLGMIAIVGGGILAGGGLLVAGQHFAPVWFGDTLTVANAVKPGIASNDANKAVDSSALQPGTNYRLRHSLNLRRTPGVDGELLAVLPADAVVSPTGIHNGDWWQVKAEKQEGWLSSLWLTRNSVQQGSSDKL